MVSPLSLAGLALSMMSQATGLPVLSHALDTAPQPSARPVVVASLPCARSLQTPARTVVRDFTAASVAPLLRPASAVIESAPAPPAPPAEIGSPSSGSEPSESPLYAQEMALVALVNRERSARGEGTLAVDLLLSNVARAHSQDMCARGYFDHYAPAPGPVTPMDRYLAAASERPAYAMVGENIFYRSATDSESEYASQSHDAFMHSPGHRANVLTAQYTHIGVGIYRNPDTGEFWVTEMFLRVADPSK